MNLPAFFLRLQTEEQVLRINKSNITAGNTLKGDHFEIQGNHESSKEEENLFLAFF